MLESLGTLLIVQEVVDRTALTQVLSTWTEILACFEQGIPVGSTWDSSGKMYKNICPGT